jgi:hypothetical protein
MNDYQIILNPHNSMFSPLFGVAVAFVFPFIPLVVIGGLVAAFAAASLLDTAYGSDASSTAPETKSEPLPCRYCRGTGIFSEEVIRNGGGAIVRTGLLQI